MDFGPTIREAAVRLTRLLSLTRGDAVPASEQSLQVSPEYRVQIAQDRLEQVASDATALDGDGREVLVSVPRRAGTRTPFNSLSGWRPVDEETRPRVVGPEIGMVRDGTLTTELRGATE